MATRQLIINRPVDTSASMLDTVSVLSKQYAFLIQHPPPQTIKQPIKDTTAQVSQDDMPPSFVTTIAAMIKSNFHYLFPAIILNPILFLHAVNAGLTAALPTLNIPHSTKTFVEPHLDINGSDRVATMYTFLIIVAQWFACQYCLDLSQKEQVRNGPGSQPEGDDYWQDG